MKFPGFLRLVIALERIADSLDRAYPPPTKPNRGRMMTERDLSYYSSEADAAAEEEEERKREAGENSISAVPHKWGYDL